MLIIGLTGPSGAGKGLVASLFATHGIPSIDTDAVYHQLLIPPSDCLDELADRFGQDILCPDGTLNRKALAHRVFSSGNASDHADLNRITHRYVLDRVQEMLQEVSSGACPAILVDAPLLFESGFDRACNKVLVVLAEPSIRLARIMTRDSLTQEEAWERIKAQKPDSFYVQRADAVIYNNGTPEDPSERVRALLSQWGVVRP
jgi:dephospho-CoA kinase